MKKIYDILAHGSTAIMGVGLFIELVAIYRYIGTSFKDMPLWVYSALILFAIGVGIKVYLLKKNYY